MIADKLAMLGIPPRIVPGVIVATFALLAGLLVALAPSWPGDAAVVAFLAALAALVDPNAGHGQAVG